MGVVRIYVNRERNVAVKNMIRWTGMLVLCLSLLIPGSAIAQQRDIDFDYDMGVMDQLIGGLASTFSYPLLGKDNDGNGMWEEHTVAMLSSVLRGGSRVSSLNTTLMNSIRTDFAYNRNSADYDMMATGTGSPGCCWLLSSAGYPCRLTEILTSSIGLGTEPATLVNGTILDLFGGLATVGDAPATFNFMNAYLDSVLNALKAGLDSSIWQYIDSVKPDIHVIPTYYWHYGASPNRTNQFGAQGNLDSNIDTIVNLTEYTTAGGNSTTTREWVSVAAAPLSFIRSLSSPGLFSPLLRCRRKLVYGHL